jgi:hypothetical protein
VGKLAQTFTTTALTVTAGVAKATYTTLTGPQLVVGQQVTMTFGTGSPPSIDALNSGTFFVTSVTPTSVSAGSFTYTNAAGVSTDTGTGKGLLKSGFEAILFNGAPTQVRVESAAGSGLDYRYNQANGTIQIFWSGSSGAISLEYTTAVALLQDTVNFEAIFPRAATV